MAKYNDFQKQMIAILDAVEGETGAAIKAGSEEAAILVTQTIRDKAMQYWPKSKYPKNWTYTEDKHGYIVHNKKTYRLAHLLNNGHRLFSSSGEYIKDTKAYPHIPSQKEVEKVSLEIMYRRLNQL